MSQIIWVRFQNLTWVNWPRSSTKYKYLNSFGLFGEFHERYRSREKILVLNPNRIPWSNFMSNMAPVSLSKTFSSCRSSVSRHFVNFPFRSLKIKFSFKGTILSGILEKYFWKTSFRHQVIHMLQNKWIYFFRRIQQSKSEILSLQHLFLQFRYSFWKIQPDSGVMRHDGFRASYIFEEPLLWQ